MDTQRNPSPEQGEFANLFTVQFAENPFPAMAHMRTIGPIVQAPVSFDGTHKIWLVTRMEEVVQILKDSKHFTVDVENIGVDENHRQILVQGQEPATDHGPITFSDSMIFVDDPDHRRLRSLVSKAFTPKYIESLRPKIQAIADELLDAVQAQGQMDLVRDYAYPLPINVISDMLGVPVSGREYVRLWSASITNGEGSEEQRFQHGQRFSDYLKQLVEEKRQHPEDDLISLLVQLEDDGDHLSERELLSMVALLIFAGHETTSNLIGIGSLMLLDHPDQLARLQADLSLIPTAVEELLRFNGPVLSPAGRYAMEDIEFGGQQIKQGDLLLMLLGSANRDEKQFTDPDELNIARSLNRHIAFGQGMHVCLGAPLARLEGDIAFATLLRRMPDLRLNVPRSSLSWHGQFNLRGVSSLPVAF